MTYYLYELNDNYMTLIEVKVYHKTEIVTLNRHGKRALIILLEFTKKVYCTF